MITHNSHQYQGPERSNSLWIVDEIYMSSITLSYEILNYFPMPENLCVEIENNPYYRIFVLLLREALPVI